MTDIAAAHRRLSRAFAILYLTLGLVVLVQSVSTVVEAVRASVPIADRHHGLILGGLETLAAVLLLIPRTMRLGASALLVIFALAFAFHAVQGDVAWPLLVYGAAVFFVRTHGVSWDESRS
jgi:uncharacterized membrane protein